VLPHCLAAKPPCSHAALLCCCHATRADLLLKLP
jgi:hypothetical protein